MGAGASSSTRAHVISYPDSISRLGTVDAARFEASFRNLCARVGASSSSINKKASSSPPPTSLSFDAFWRYVVHPAFPNAPKWIFQRLFAAFSDIQKMPGDASASITAQAAIISDVNNPLVLTLEDWTCAVCLIMCGTFEEKAKLLARMLDNGSCVVTSSPVTPAIGDAATSSNGYQATQNSAAIFSGGRIRYDMLLRTVSEILYDKKIASGVASIEMFVKETMIDCWAAGEEAEKERIRLIKEVNSTSAPTTSESQQFPVVTRSRRCSFSNNSDGNLRNSLTITADEFRLWALKQSLILPPATSSSWVKNPLLGWLDLLQKLFKPDHVLRRIGLAYTSGRGETLKSFLTSNRLVNQSSLVPGSQEITKHGSKRFQKSSSRSAVLTATESLHLSRAFTLARQSSKSGLFDLAVLHNAFLPGSPRVLNEALFRACDNARNGAISVSDISNVAAVLLHGSLSQQSTLLFTMFSSTSSALSSIEFNSLLLIAQWVGVLVSRTAPESITSSSASIEQKLPPPVIFDSATGNSNTKLLLRLQSEAQATLSSLVGAACEEMNCRAFPIDLEIFVKWATHRHPELLSCLEPIKMGLRIELGVRPPFGSRRTACESLALPQSSSSNALSLLATDDAVVAVSSISEESSEVTASRNLSINNEGDVIAACWRSYSRKDAQEEDQWFVVPSIWWRQWCGFSAFFESLERIKGDNQSQDTSSTQNHRIDEPNSSSVTSSSSSSSTMSSFKSSDPETPGLIPTHLLLVDHLIVSGTSSGGSSQANKHTETSLPPPSSGSSSQLPARLLPNLSRGFVNDFVLVPPRVWKALSLWYGVSGPPIRRQVINTRGFRKNRSRVESSHSQINDEKSRDSFLELELYPLVIRAQLLQAAASTAPALGTSSTSSNLPVLQSSANLPSKAPSLTPVLNIEVLGDQPALPGPATSVAAVDVFMFSRAERLTTVRERLARALKKDASHVRLWRPMPRATIAALSNGVDAPTLSLLGLFPYSPLWGIESPETVNTSALSNLSTLEYESVASWDLVKSSPGSVFIGNVYPPLIDGTQLLVDVQVAVSPLEDMSLSRTVSKRQVGTTNLSTTLTWSSVLLGYQSAYDSVIRAVELKALRGGRVSESHVDGGISLQTSDKSTSQQPINTSRSSPSSKKDLKAQAQVQQQVQVRPLSEKQQQIALSALNSHRAAPPPPLPRQFRLRPRSLLGLTNMGNTCYLSSAFQCLLSLPYISHYFLSGLWEADLNVDSKDGTGGTLAAAFALAVQEAWEATAAEGEVSAVMTLKRLKAYLAYSAHQYRGKNQHDANEALDHLLDKLSEDLNRVRGPKPFIEAPDSEGRPDAQVAEEYFVHQIFGREKSFFTAMMMGQFKCMLFCENCGHSNVKFDAFRPLTVTLPEPVSRAFTVLVVFGSSVETTILRPLVVTVHVPLTATVGDLKKAIATAAREHQQRRGLIMSKPDNNISTSFHEVEEEGKEEGAIVEDDNKVLEETVSSPASADDDDNSKEMDSSQEKNEDSVSAPFNAQAPLTERDPGLLLHVPITEEHLLLVRASCQCLEDLGLGDQAPVSSAQKLSEHSMTALVAFQTTPERHFKEEYLSASRKFASSSNVKDAIYSPGAPVYIWTSLGSQDGTSYKWRQGRIMSRQRAVSINATASQDKSVSTTTNVDSTSNEPILSPLTSQMLPLDVDSDDSTGGVRTRTVRNSFYIKNKETIDASVPIEVSASPPLPPLLPSPPSALVHTVAVLVNDQASLVDRNVARIRLEPRFPVPVVIHLQHRTFLIVGTGNSPFGNLADAGRGSLGPCAPVQEPVGAGAAGLSFIGSTIPPAAASSSAFFLTNLTRCGFGPPSLLRLLPSQTTLSELYVRAWLSAKRYIRRRAPFEQDDIDTGTSSSSSSSSSIPDAPNSICESQENANRLPGEYAIRIMSNWGFVLRKSFANGTHGCPSSSCQWLHGCDGCVIAPDKNMTVAVAGLGAVGIDASTDGFGGGGPWISLAVEWDPNIIEQSYDRVEAFAKDFHPSVARARTEAETPISLERCLEQSSKPERLEGQYCSKCSKVKKRVKKQIGLAAFLSSGSSSNTSIESGSGSNYDLSPTSSSGAPSQVSIKLRNENKILPNTSASCEGPLADDEEEVEEIIERVKFKTLEVYRLPPILVIQLKRFRYTTGTASSGGIIRGKLSTRVSFPVSRTLCMRPHMTRGPPPIGDPADLSMWRFLGGKEEQSPEQIPTEAVTDAKRSYRAERRASGGPTERLIDGLPLLLSRSTCDFELFAVINHYGALSGGHYVATARAPVNDRWYMYDDQKVTPLSLSGPELDAQVCTPAAYILFYVRKDIAAGWRASLRAEDEAIQRSLDQGSGEVVSPSPIPSGSKRPYKIPPAFQRHCDSLAGHYDELDSSIGSQHRVSVENLFPLASGFPAESTAKVLERISGPDIALDGLEPGPATNTVSGGAVAGALASVLSVVPGIDKTKATETARGIVNNVVGDCTIA
jgi:ubiquitin C-terminal hydrolase